MGGGGGGSGGGVSGGAWAVDDSGRTSWWGSRRLWNTSNCWQAASGRETSQRAFIACASAAPLPGAAWNVTTSRTAMAFSSRGRICIDQYHDPPAAASSAPRDGEEAHRASSCG